MNCKYSVYHNKSRNYLLIFENNLKMTPNNLCLSVHQNQRNFFDSKKSFQLNYRIKSLKKLKATIIKFEKNIVDALKLDLGKSYAESYMSEISIIYNEINYVLRNVKKWSKRKKVSSSLLNFFSTDYIQPNPYGVTLNISPWNYPFQLSISPIIGAISAGNTVVLKPSEHSPHTTAILETIINEAFSRGHVDIITGGPKTGKNLLELNWDYIFFTGSTRIGKIIAEKAAKNLTPITLELGGKSPCIVDTGVDLDKVAKRIVSGKFVNCGQTCIAPDYIVVNNHVKDELISMIKKNIILTYGNSSIKSDSYGRIINKNNLVRLKEILNKSNVEFGGKIEEEKLFIEPTLIIEPDLNSEIMNDEIFGPILPILSYENENEIQTIIEKNPSPLAFYIFSKNQKFIDKLVQNNKFGGCVVNDTLIHYVNPNLPFGGIGTSGLGAYRGKFSFDTFTHYKPILEKKSMIDLPFRYGPYPESFSLIKKILDKL